jgi:c-di-GMP-binding flagellar brake protein YcgR
MRPRRVLESRDASAIFDRAVQEKALAVLTLQDGSDWATFKSRFLERDPHGKFFVLDYQSPTGDALPDLSPGQYVGVSFRQRSRKVLFATIVEAKGHFVCPDDSSIPAIRYRWPDAMTELQRRAYYRTPIPPDVELKVRAWVGGVAAPDAHNPELSPQTVSGTLADLSCGGTMLNLAGGIPAHWSDQTLLGLELELPDGKNPIRLDARYRGARAGEEHTGGAAVQFLGLELTVDGRAVLQRLANCVQKLHRASMTDSNRNWNGRASRS